MAADGNIRLRDDHAEIMLSDGSIAIIDKEDVPKVSGVNWWGLRCKNGVYAQAKVDGKRVYLHRVIADATPGLEADHRDRNTLNCRRKNLRVVTHAQNQRNMSRPKNNTSGFKGVGWIKRAGCWCARIHHNGKEISLGCFHNPADAALAYDAASRRLHGEYGATNSDLMRA